MVVNRNLGMVLLGVWLIVWGLMAALALSFQSSNVLMGVLAFIAGILILVGR